MKKYLFLLLSPFLFVNSVYATDTTITLKMNSNPNEPEIYYLNNLPYTTYAYYDNNNQYQSSSCSSRTDCYNNLITIFENSGKQYYSIDLAFTDVSIRMIMRTFDYNNENILQSVSINSSNYRFYFYVNDSSLISNYRAVVLSSDSYANFYLHYDSNFIFSNTNNYYFKNFYYNETDDFNNMLQVLNNENLPKIKDLMNYSSWSDYVSNMSNDYTIVNLDNYEYVILSLKDYSIFNPFQTTLQVKGQIGITPVYNYGQTSKDSITGVQVQDRCNLSYSDFTSYPFYIIQSDLQNNAIFYVKECQENSSFKFDNTIFDITYITQNDLDSPTITINGTTYDTIPYSDLPSTATQNEENNYIPGQSGSATDTGGLDSAIKSAQNNLSAIWNTFTYFTDFIGLIFSSLPTSLSVILISAFIIMLTLGIIKVFLGH